MISRLLPFVLALGTSVTIAQTTQRAYPIQPIPFTAVSIADHFWMPRLETVKRTTIPYAFDQCEQTGRIKNFEIAGALADGSFCSKYAFDDSDVYKVMEGAAYALQVHPDPALEKYLDSLIAKIAAAQEPDGYLYTWRTIYDREKAAGKVKEPTLGQFHRGSDTRWQREDQHSHELYNVGHLYEAAVAHHLATGKRSLLDVALKNAELVEASFGWGKIEKATGHQEIELGLAKLYLLTGERKYLDLAKFFLDVRGYGDEYMQNHKKVKDQTEIVGHAVRACYMFAAMADVTALTGDQTYMPALKSLWQDVVGRKMYITGGIGSSGSNEGFSKPYDLPNYSAYCETCSSIAFVLWAQRMFLLTGESQYIDVLERTLYNALNAGLSFTGDRFFYPNPLESRKNVERSPWFACACCPSNVARFFPSLPGYVYAHTDNALYLNLFATSKTTVGYRNAGTENVPVTIRQESNYPWEGRIVVRVESREPVPFSMKLRIPGWATGDAVPFDLYEFQGKPTGSITLTVNGKPLPLKTDRGYAVIERTWKQGDSVEWVLPMPVQRVVAHPNVEENRNMAALQRGPIVYCLEGKDQPDERVLNLFVPDETTYSSQFESGLLSGVQTISFAGNLVKDPGSYLPLKLKAIPYYSWANRGKDNMVVWLPYELSAARPVTQPTIASKSRIMASDGVKGELAAIADQYLPQSSSDDATPLVHWWPRKGTAEWLQYDFDQAEQVGTVRVYWVDETVTGGEVRAPRSWKVRYLENGEWKNAYAPDGFPVEKDFWSEAQFEPVKTKALRIEFTAQVDAAVGVHEWEVR